MLDTQPNATDAVMAENMFNDPPADGHQFFIVVVRAKYLGPGSVEFWGSSRLKALGASGIVYSTFENSCGVIPNELPDPELFTGGTVEGAECWSIASEDADSLTLILEEGLFTFSDERAWFALR